MSRGQCGNKQFVDISFAEHSIAVVSGIGVNSFRLKKRTEMCLLLRLIVGWDGGGDGDYVCECVATALFVVFARNIWICLSCSHVNVFHVCHKPKQYRSGL